MVLLLVLHLRQPIAFIPVPWTGKGQLFYLVFLWTIVSMNFMLVLPRFTPIRLVTEWFITLNAIACTIPLVYACFARSGGTVIIAAEASSLDSQRHHLRIARLGRGPLHRLGDQIRFGPNNTNTIR